MFLYGNSYTEIHGTLVSENPTTITIRMSTEDLINIPRRFISEICDQHTWIVETWYLKKFRVIPLYP